MSDQFLAIENPSNGYYMDRKSKFLSYAFPVETEEAVSSCLMIIRKEHPKARHFCTAFRLYPDASLERSNDDGEPSGSAGKPILGQLIKHNLTNTLIIVVRYFGGTKLGVPGLIEAYKTSAANAIASGTIITRSALSQLRIEMSYDSFPHFLNFCKQYEIPVQEEIFTERASLIISFPKSKIRYEIINALHNYSKLDFEKLEDYLLNLDMNIEFIQGSFYQ